MLWVRSGCNKHADERESLGVVIVRFGRFWFTLRSTNTQTHIQYVASGRGYGVRASPRARVSCFEIGRKRLSVFRMFLYFSFAARAKRMQSDLIA